MEGIYRFAKETNLEIIAVCDPWRLAREEANAKVSYLVRTRCPAIYLLP